VANGTFIADIAHEIVEYSGKYERIGAILYFRSHDCKIKFTKSPPLEKNIIGKFKTSEKVPEAPMIEGDLFVNGGKIGHIHSEQNGVGETLYWMRIEVAIPIQGVTLWAKVKLEDKE
jgi:YHS domain-containing protein